MRLQGLWPPEQGRAYGRTRPWIPSYITQQPPYSGLWHKQVPGRRPRPCTTGAPNLNTGTRGHSSESRVCRARRVRDPNSSRWWQGSKARGESLRGRELSGQPAPLSGSVTTWGGDERTASPRMWQSHGFNIRRQETKVLVLSLPGAF